MDTTPRLYVLDVDVAEVGERSKVNGENGRPSSFTTFKNKQNNFSRKTLGVSLPCKILFIHPYPHSQTYIYVHTHTYICIFYVKKAR